MIDDTRQNKTFNSTNKNIYNNSNKYHKPKANFNFSNVFSYSLSFLMLTHTLHISAEVITNFYISSFKFIALVRVLVIFTSRIKITSIGLFFGHLAIYWPAPPTIHRGLEWPQFLNSLLARSPDDPQRI